MLSKIKSFISKDKKLILYPFILSLLFFGVNVTLEYATDTYATFEELGTWQWMLYENGRIFNALIYYVIEALQIPNGYVYKLSYAFAILFLTLSIYFFSKLLKDFCRNDLLYFILGIPYYWGYLHQFLSCFFESYCRFLGKNYLSLRKFIGDTISSFTFNI